MQRIPAASVVEPNINNGNGAQTLNFNKKQTNLLSDQPHKQNRYLLSREQSSMAYAIHY